MLRTQLFPAGCGRRETKGVRAECRLREPIMGRGERWERWLCSSKDPRAVRHFSFSSNVGSVSYKDLGNRMAMQDYSGILFGF